MTASASPDIRLKRIYDAPHHSDGFRALVDRLWPRGLKKEDARIDLWARDIAPTSELRTWYDHDPDKWEEFQKRYQAELGAAYPDNSELVESLLEPLRAGAPVTLLTSTKEIHQSHLPVIKAWLEERVG